MRGTFLQLWQLCFKSITFLLFESLWKRGIWLLLFYPFFKFTLTDNCKYRFPLLSDGQDVFHLNELKLRELQEWKKRLSEQEILKIDADHKYELLENYLETMNNEFDCILL